MPKGKGPKAHFRRAEMIQEMRNWDDQRWKKAARRDLKELALDEEGIERLSAAIKAILRGR